MDSETTYSNTPMFRGMPVQLPLDLFIPSNALELLMERFEGPLDLLLYLIKKNHFDILDIPIAEIAKQYTDYVALLDASRFDLASEYLVMAAWLAEIKSRLLLPRPAALAQEEEGADPRAVLVLRLQTYEIFKNAALEIDKIPRLERDLFLSGSELPRLETRIIPPHITANDLVMALRDVLKKANMMQHHIVNREILSVRERMTKIYEQLHPVDFIRFETLFDSNEGKLGIAVTFMAMLEMIKLQQLEIIQAKAFSPIYLRLFTSHHACNMPNF